MMASAANDVARHDWSEMRTCVVLGGRGFTGRSLVSRLLRLRTWTVRVADSAQSLQLDNSYESESVLSDALSSGQASYFSVDVRDVSQIKKVIDGAYIVFYMEPSDLDTHDFYRCYMAIVQGAKNVLSACRECAIKRLLYNSSADVMFDGSKDIQNGDESLTCPSKFPEMLIDLKAHAEALIISANDIDGLLTCALRPSNTFGPGDTRLVPFLVNLAIHGFAKFIIGTGENMLDFTFVENVAHAHVRAAEALDSKVVSVAGKAFFITNLKPMKFNDFVSLILRGLHYERPFIKLPTGMAFFIVSLVEWVNEKLQYKLYNCSMSACYFVQIASHTRTFNCTAAKNHFGYTPIVSLEDGIIATVKSFSHMARDPFMRYGGESKVEKFLGSGKVAEILLWRDEKKTFASFIGVVMLFYWYFLCGSTFVSTTAKFFLLMAVCLYGYSILASEILGFSAQRMSLSSFEIPETVVRDSVRSVACLWNRGARNVRSLGKGEDLSTFLKATVSLYTLKWIVFHHYLPVAVGMVIVFVFTAFFIYEQYESELNGLAMVLYYGAEELKRLLIRKLPPSIASFFQYLAKPHQEKVPHLLKIGR